MMIPPFLLSITLVILVLFLQPPAADAHEHPELPFDVYVVPPEPISGVDIHWEDLFGEGAQAPDVIRVYGPFQGDLRATAEGYYYAVQPSLWVTKVDSFVLDYYEDGVRNAINVVVVVGEARPGEAFENDPGSVAPHRPCWPKRVAGPVDPRTESQGGES